MKDEIRILKIHNSFFILCFSFSPMDAENRRQAFCISR